MNAFTIFWIVVAIGALTSFIIEASNRKNLRFMIVSGGAFVAFIFIAIRAISMS